LEEASEQSRGDSFLTEGRRVDVVVRLQEGAEGRPKLGSVLDVNGGLVGNDPGTPQPGGLRLRAKLTPPGDTNAGQEVGPREPTQLDGTARRRIE
jgi:hypothetical protein